MYYVCTYVCVTILHCLSFDFFFFPRGKLGVFCLVAELLLLGDFFFFFLPLLELSHTSVPGKCWAFFLRCLEIFNMRTLVAVHRTSLFCLIRSTRPRIHNPTTEGERGSGKWCGRLLYCRNQVSNPEPLNAKSDVLATSAPPP